VKEFFTFEEYIIACFVKKQPAIIIIKLTSYLKNDSGSTPALALP